MKYTLFLMMAVCVAGVMSAQAQTATDLNEGVRVTKNPQTGVLTLTWWGRSGRTYFIQQSEDLMTWAYVPTIQSGTAAVTGLNFSCSNPRQFWRLRYTDAATGGNALTADFDDDWISNDDELALGTDPFAEDSDGDGYRDGQEQQQNSNPLSAAQVPTLELADTENTALFEKPVYLVYITSSMLPTTGVVMDRVWSVGLTAPELMATNTTPLPSRAGRPNWIH